jgi:hypothetical protein
MQQTKNKTLGFLFVFLVLGIKPRASHMLVKCSLLSSIPKPPKHCSDPTKQVGQLNMDFSFWFL